MMDEINCKYCGKENTVIKYGTYKDKPLYYCKACMRKFKDDDALFHMKVPSNYVSSSLDMYYRGMSIEDICEHLKQEYNYKPSKSVIFGWVNKYTDLARKHFRNYHPEVGDVWIADETMLNIDKDRKIWFYDIIDEKTRFLLASHPAISRTTGDAEMLMREAAIKAGKKPKEVVTDQNNAYMDGIGEAYGAKTEHILGSPFKLKTTGESTSKIERFHETLKDRTKIFKSFRDINTLIEFTDGWLIYYNYFKPHSKLDGKTPAQMARIKYDVTDWSKLVQLSRDKSVDSKIVQPKLSVDMSKAFKRHRRHRNPQDNLPNNKSIREVR